MNLLLADYEWKHKMRFVRIYFDTPTFDRITKDRAAKFVDMLSASGGSGVFILAKIAISNKTPSGAKKIDILKKKNYS